MRRTKQLSISELADKICELEAYIEFLENRLDKHISFSRETDLNRLCLAKSKLNKLKNAFNKV